MTARGDDGSAGDADYGRISRGYSRYRRPDPRIAARIWEALGDARSVLNLGAGAGSYEPTGRAVTAVEPSASMRAQRPAHLPAAVDATAEALPFPDKAFDAAMATFTVHQWSDLRRGLSEMRRVTRGPVVVLTCDPDLVDRFWLNDYAPEVLAEEARRYPALHTIGEALEGTTEIQSVPIPAGCLDGFNEAYFGRPEGLLDAGARLACSAWSFVGEAVQARFEDTLRADLESGLWDRRWGALRDQPQFDGSLRLVVSLP